MVRYSFSSCQDGASEVEVEVPNLIREKRTKSQHRGSRPTKKRRQPVCESVMDSEASEAERLDRQSSRERLLEERLSGRDPEANLPRNKEDDPHDRNGSYDRIEERDTTSTPQRREKSVCSQSSRQAPCVQCRNLKRKLRRKKEKVENLRQRIGELEEKLKSSTPAAHASEPTITIKEEPSDEYNFIEFI